MHQTNSDIFQKRKDQYHARLFRDLYVASSKTLCNVLRDIKDIYEQAELDTQQEKHLDEISRSCRSGLNELLSKLDEYQELDLRTNSLGGTCRRVWKRLKWDQAEMDEICQRIQSNVQIYNLFSTSLTRYGFIIAQEGECSQIPKIVK